MGANRKGLLISVIALTSLLIVLQLASGIWLFVNKLTLEPAHIAATYLGDPDAFIAGKTVLGVLQTALPHVVAMGTVALMMGHLLPHCGISDRKVRGISLMMLAGVIGEVGTPFLILSVSPLFGWGKLVSFLLFEGAIGVTVIAVLASSIKRHTY